MIQEKELAQLLTRTTFLVCLAVWSAGCGADAKQVGEDPSGRAVTLAAGQELIVALESNRTTGYARTRVFPPDEG